jgi:hypothetical protein
MVEKPSMQNLIMYNRPQTKPTDIPGRTKVTEEIHEKVKVVRAILKDEFAVCIPYKYHLFAT